MTIQENKLRIAVMEGAMIENKEDHAEIKAVLVRIETKLDTKTDQLEFVFWRNILVSGIMISIFIGIISLMVERYIS